jgi:hypothetical protein
VEALAIGSAINAGDELVLAEVDGDNGPWWSRRW